MRVLIVRLRAIGDVIHGVPVACALKDQIPGAFVAWLAEDWASEVLVGHPAIDRLITVRPGWTHSLPQTVRLRRELRDLRIDVVLDLQGARGSVLAASMAGASRRLGFVGMVSHQARRVIPNEDTQRVLSRLIAGVLGFELVKAHADHIVDRYLEILAPLGLAAPQVRFGFPESEDDVPAVAGAFAGAFAVINPGGSEWKMWPADRFATVASYLGSVHALATVVLQGRREWEQEAARDIVAGSGGPARLAAPMSLRQLGALARKSRVFISGDTGPLHLAAAVGAPCIGLIGHALANRFGPYGARNITLQGEPVPTYQARRSRLGADAMKAIGVEDVCRACDRMLL